MPTMHIELFEGRTPEKKRELVRALTERTCEVLGCQPDSVDIILTEISKERWATGGVFWSEKDGPPGSRARAGPGPGTAPLLTDQALDLLAQLGVFAHGAADAVVFGDTHAARLDLVHHFLIRLDAHRLPGLLILGRLELGLVFRRDGTDLAPGDRIALQLRVSGPLHGPVGCLSIRSPDDRQGARRAPRDDRDRQEIPQGAQPAPARRFRRRRAFRTGMVRRKNGFHRLIHPVLLHCVIDRFMIAGEPVHYKFPDV